VGTAPLAILQDVLLAAGWPVVALLGFRDAAHAAGGALLADARLATDDGGAGHAGLVTELLAAELDGGGATVVYACGPPAMLEAVRALCAERAVPAQLALESGMACGFGACFGCVVALRDGTLVRLCVDGPVIAGDALASCLVPGHEAAA
jgi:NAD(P)H-flavin reductase